MFPSSKVSVDVKEISGCDFLSKETENLRKASEKDHRLSLPFKRNRSSYMETFKSDLTQSHGFGNGKRLSRDSLKNNGIKPISCTERLENSQGFTTSTNDSLIRETKKSVGRFLYENGIDFNVVQSPSFQSMISFGSGDMKDKIPTCQELKGWIFEEAMNEMREHVDEMRKSWAETGCSVLLDGWTDAKDRNLINILVDCPRGTIYLRSADISDYIGSIDAMLMFVDQVINDVGTENVVQITTYSTSSFMKELGKQLMAKHRLIFWTVGASCCIDLMLEKMKKMDLINETLDKAKTIVKFIHNDPKVMKVLQDHGDGHDLIKPSKIRSALPFLALENIVSEEKILRRMFLSSNSDSSILTSTMEGKKVAELVGSRSFWSAAMTVLKAAFPLVRVMELMDDNKTQMGYIYETIDQAKETIREGFNRKKSQYEPFWKAIDDVWNEHLYSPLHSAGYFLNPSLFYSDDVSIDQELLTGLIFCVVHASNNLHVQDAITLELEKYRKAKGAFSVGCTIEATSDIPPALWWSKYGGECPELQRLAVRILNQTCDGASKFHLKRSLVEALLTSGENQIEQQRLSDMIFLHYNLQLQSSIASYEFDPMNDWILHEAQNDMSINGSPLDGGDKTGN